MSAGHAHSHAVTEGKTERPLWIALFLTTGFLVAELIGGILTNSLALISDAAHMFTDTAALAISLFAIRIARRQADERRTFGYYRFEILAAAFNAVLLFLVALYILFEAYQRLKTPPEVQSGMMFVIASVGLIVNLISMRLLSAGKDASLNIKGAYLEVWSDMVGSVGVIIGAIVIRFTGWGWVDSIVAVAIGIWVVPRTWALLKASMHVLLEGTPENVDIPKLEAAILAVPGVASIHDLHVWSITSGKHSVNVHIVGSDANPAWPTLLTSVRKMLADDFELHHATVQLEQIPCEQDTEAHAFGPATQNQANKVANPH